MASQNSTEQGVAIVVMVIGAWITAFGVAHMLQMTDEIALDLRESRLKVNRMNQYMEHCKLSNELRAEVREFMNQIGKKVHARSLQREEKSLLSDLSIGLRAKVAHAINHSTLKKVPFFDNFRDDEFISRLCMGMCSVYASVGEEISREKEWMEVMYFVVSGSVEVIKKELVSIPRDATDNATDIGDFIEEAENEDDDQKKEVVTRVALLGAGEYWGERAMLSERVRHSTTNRAVEFTELRQLPREYFVRAAENFPMIQKKVEKLSNTNMDNGSGADHLEEETDDAIKKHALTLQNTWSTLNNIASLFSPPAGSSGTTSPEESSSTGSMCTHDVDAHSHTRIASFAPPPPRRVPLLRVLSAPLTTIPGRVQAVQPEKARQEEPQESRLKSRFSLAKSTPLTSGSEVGRERSVENAGKQEPAALVPPRGGVSVSAEAEERYIALQTQLTSQQRLLEVRSRTTVMSFFFAALYACATQL